MLNEKRIREAEQNVGSYLSEGLLKKIKEPEKSILDIFKKNSEESLKIADHLSKNNLSWLWVIVCSYYTMYYMANAVLYKLGYKIGHKISHKITADALIVFVRGKLKKKLLEDFEEIKEEALELVGIKVNGLIESFDHERIKRSRFQYEMGAEVRKNKARISLKRAKEFVFEIEKLLM